jgi:hypothetical protein
MSVAKKISLSLAALIVCAGLSAPTFAETCGSGTGSGANAPCDLPATPDSSLDPLVALGDACAGVFFGGLGVIIGILW